MTTEFIFEQAPFASCHASTILEPEPGKLIAAWFGGAKEGANDVKIWWSRHDGMSWSPPEVAAEEAGQPCWNPVLFKSKAGTLFLFYKAGPSPSTWSGFVRRSMDAGKTWSKPEILPAGLLGLVKNKPIQRADGTILAGTSVESYHAWACWIERSQDDGKTWKRFGPITVPDHPYGIIQPTLFEAKDGRVIMLVRSRGLGVICKTSKFTLSVTATASSIFLLAKVPDGATILSFEYFIESGGADNTWQLGILSPEGSASTTLTRSALSPPQSDSPSAVLRPIGINLPYPVSISSECLQRWVWVTAVNAIACSASAVMVTKVYYQMNQA